MRSKEKTEYFDAVLRQVRFTWDHEEIEYELDEHILEECAYLRARKGLDDAAAEAESLRRMGSPEELGRMLNQVHNPWIGRLWILTTLLLIVLILPVGRIAIGELIDAVEPLNQDTRTAAEKLVEEKLSDSGIFYRIPCDAVLELDTYEIRFTDVICAYERNITEQGMRLYLFYELTGDDKAGSYAVNYMSPEMFLLPNGETAAEVIIPGVEKPSRDEANTKAWTFFTGEGYVCTYRFDRSTKYIDVEYNVFGQEDTCRIDLTEGIKQAEARVGVEYS